MEILECSFVVDDKGDKKAVLIDLEKYGELWENFYDLLISQQREDEEEINCEDWKQESARNDDNKLQVLPGDNVTVSYDPQIDDPIQLNFKEIIS